MSQYPPPPFELQRSVCPRHPQREAYVRCQRCQQPCCPECQRPAAVGVQCIDCVRADAKAAPQVSGAFGGTVAHGNPIVTMTIIGLCVVAYIAQLAIPSVTSDFAFGPVIGWREPWRFITAAFLHSETMYAHILFNLMSLWFLGQYLEPLLGRVRFALLYLLSAVGGSVTVLLLAQPPLGRAFDPAWVSGTVGASGAIFGLFGAMLVLNRHLGRDSSAMYLTLAINFAFGFIYPNISWQAHLGGLVVGALTAGIVAAFGKANQRALQFVGMALVLVVLVGLVFIKYGAVPVGLK